MSAALPLNVKIIDPVTVLQRWRKSSTARKALLRAFPLKPLIKIKALADVV
jgi:hypothetical protein